MSELYHFVVLFFNGSHAVLVLVVVVVVVVVVLGVVVFAVGGLLAHFEAS